MRIPIRVVCAAIIAIAVAACSLLEEQETSANPTPPEAPLPTIGIESDVFTVSGSAPVRQIDTSQVDSVMVIGDSITVGARESLEGQLNGLGFENVNINAQQSKRANHTFGDNTSGAEIAAFVASSDDRGAKQLWVIALGTNDIGQFPSGEEERAAVQAVLDEVPDDAPLVWINTIDANRPDATASMNAAIDAAVGARPNSIVGRWNDVATADGVLRRDGIHPSDEGAQVFSDLVVTTISDYLQR